MTAPLHNPARPSALTASQSTAAVAEFRCLFTLDLRRKQKRWQDGFLKLHSFNSRVMVYDANRNFVGDTYWKESSALQEGDELTLDKGVIVEVAEAIGMTQTDLAPLFEKNKKPQQPPPATASRSLQGSNAPRTGSQGRHKSLNALLGTPKGPIGKAMPIRSPYEVRMEQEREKGKEKENEWTAGRAAKRQKTAHDMVAIASSSPPPKVSLPKRAPVQTPKVPSRHPRLARSGAIETPLPPPRSSSPPVSVSNRLANVEFALQPTKRRGNEQSPSASPPRDPRAKSLRLSTGVRRKMLVCQSLQPSPDKVRARHAVPRTKEASLSAGKDGSLRREKATAALDPSSWSFDEDLLIQEEAADFAISSVTPNETTKQPWRKDTDQSRKPSARNQVSRPSSQSRTAFEDVDIIHGLMDQRMLPKNPVNPKQVEQCTVPPLLKSSARESDKHVVDIVEDSRETHCPPSGASSPVTTGRKPPSTNTRSATSAVGRLSQKLPLPEEPRPHSTVDMPDTSRPVPISITIPDSPPLERSLPPSPLTGIAAASPVLASVSPTKLKPKLALSTGGFRKKAQKAGDSATPGPIPKQQKQAVHAAPSETLHVLPTEPVSATTRRAQPKKRPNEDQTLSEVHDRIAPVQQPPSTKRSRKSKTKSSCGDSEPPIPSISEEWERQNLPRRSSRSASDPEHTGTRPAIPAKDEDNQKANVAAAAFTKIQQQVKRSRAVGLAALVQKTDPRRKALRSLFLNVDVDTNVRPANKAGVFEVGAEIMSPVADEDVGPWSTEAFDLMTWRPPGNEAR